MQGCARSLAQAATDIKKTRRRRKFNAAVCRQIFGGVGGVGFSAAAEFGGAGRQGSKLAQQPRYNVLCLGSSMSPRDLAYFGFRLCLNLSITKTLLLNSNSANIIAHII
jgi:hypothetical protein